MKQEKELGVTLGVEKITFEGKTFAEIKAIAKQNNEARLKALAEAESQTETEENKEG